MRNQSGLITVDFIFAMVLVLGFSGLLFVLTMTLSVASMLQYITFASARNYNGAHLTPGDQEQQAQAKYKELIGNSVFKPLFSNGWFQIDAEATVGDHAKVIPAYGDAGQGVSSFIGTGSRFVARVLDFQIPFFGSTAPDDDGTGSGFKTYMGSYLGREVTTDECLNFVKERWKTIRNLSVSGAANYSSGTQDQGYYSFSDDGC